jgi:hypothetical protein
MPDNEDSGYVSERLRLASTGLPSQRDSLRTRGVRFTPTAAAAAPDMTVEPAKASTKKEHEVPGVVLLIGLYEFARAVTLAVIYGMMLSDPHTHMFSAGFWTSFYVLSNGALSVTPFLPLTIIYAFAVGTCLWMRVNWGRRVLIATSCWALFRLARFLLFYETFVANATDAEVASISYVREAAFMLAAVNIIIGAYLAFAPGIAEAFGQEK